MDDLKRTGLYDLHLSLGAKMVPFAGYEMPVQYPMGVLREHLHTRAQAGLFDVSHMGQVMLRPASGNLDDAARALEALVPVDILGLKQGRQRYATFTSEAGGILDDLMVAHRGDHLFLVVNAARAEADLAHLRACLPDDIMIEPVSDRLLLALQGPGAEDALVAVAPAVRGMRFMDVAVLPSDFGELWISRSGYTGEDGFEISVPEARGRALAEALLAERGVAPVGLGARDSLRLEAGLCLYGADLDETTSPAEAALGWAIQKTRRRGGAREGGFPGAERILMELEEGPTRLRVGLLPEGRAPMRAGTELFADETGGAPAGVVTSGAFGPSIDRPVSMGYVVATYAALGTRLFGEVRGRRLPAIVSAMPFHPTTYKR
jgi:aminomethyltransferase